MNTILNYPILTEKKTRLYPYAKDEVIFLVVLGVILLFIFLSYVILINILKTY